MSSITKVLQGTEMLTPKTQKEAMELLKGLVPAAWQKAWEGPENPTNWIRLINKKSQGLISWVKKCDQGQLLAQPVNLSTLFHPEIFINALRQRSARHLSKAIDELKLVSSFESDKIPRDVSIQLEGLWLQGSTF